MKSTQIKSSLRVKISIAFCSDKNNIYCIPDFGGNRSGYVGYTNCFSPFKVLVCFLL